MNPQGTVQITDKESWRKIFPLPKSLIHIGSDPHNDIVLEPWRGQGVSPRHLQLIAIPGQGQRFRAVNLGESDIRLIGEEERTLPPRSAAEIGDGERVRLGDFLLIFQLGGAAPAAGPAATAAPGRPAVQGTTAAIGLSLNLPATDLAPDRPLEGRISVQNLGDRPGVQFKLEVEGLDEDCYEIGAGPILFPGVAKDVLLRLHHPRRPRPPAGPHQIRIRATADEYPGEAATVTQEIRILPFYSHELRLLAEE